MIEETKPKPNYPCHNCHSTAWWRRPDSQWGPGEWLCNRCYPNPNKEVKVSTDKGHCRHGEFTLSEGCEECIAERRAAEKSAAGNLQVNKTSSHQVYRVNNEVVPSVTTVLKVLDKGEGLTYWAWNLGKQGLDYKEVRDSAARVGTLAHSLIANHLKGAPGPGSGGYSPAEVTKSEKCMVKYLKWEKEHSISPVMIETPQVSSEFKYGGTPDLLAEYNDEFILIDFKTGGGIHDSMFYQLAGYRQLLTEQGWPVANARILRISANDDNYEEVIKTNLDVEWQIFLKCLEIYRLRDLGGSIKILDKLLNLQ